MRNAIICFLVLSFMHITAYGQEMAKDRKAREFLVSATYGTLVGALVGAATLAFEDDPGENLQRIARGASLGLYAGILLGIYVTSSHKETPEGEGEQAPPEEESIPGVDVYFEPMFKDKKIDGMTAHFTVLRF